MDIHIHIDLKLYQVSVEEEQISKVEVVLWRLLKLTKIHDEGEGELVLTEVPSQSMKLGATFCSENKPDVDTARWKFFAPTAPAKFLLTKARFSR